MYTEPYGSVSTSAARPRFLRSLRLHSPRDPRAPRPLRRVDQRPRRQIRDDPHWDEEAREGPRERRTGQHKKGRPGPYLQARAPAFGRRDSLDREVPGNAGRPPQPSRGIPRAHKRNRIMTTATKEPMRKSIVTKPSDREIRIEREFN